MRVRRLFSGILIALVAVPPASTEPLLATLKGSLTLEDGGSPGAPIDVRFVDLDTGRVVDVQTDVRGRFEAQLEPGVYSLDLSKGGYEIVLGPHVIAATPGENRIASLALAAVTPEQGAPPVGPRIVHDAIGCMPAEENPEVDAVIEPAALIKEPRVYFHAAGDQRFYYVDMIPEVGRFVACLPPPHLRSGPVTYYVAASLEGVPSRTADIKADVISASSACPAGRRMAVVCPCALPVAAYLPDGVATIPPGFEVGTSLGAGLGSTAIKIGAGLGIIGIGLLLGNGAPASPSR